MQIENSTALLMAAALVIGLIIPIMATGSGSLTTRALKIFSEYPIVTILVGVLLLFLGISLKHHGWSAFVVDKDFVGTVIAEFGVALIIAYFISVSIEQYSRQRHDDHVAAQIDKIQESVFGAVYKARYDKNYIDFIENELLKYPFYRENYDLSMTIEPHPTVRHKASLDPQDPILITVKLRSMIANITKLRQGHVLGTTLELPCIGGLESEPRLCLVMLGKEEYIFANDQEFKEARIGVIKSDNRFKRYRIPREFEPNERLQIEYQYQIIKHARDEISWRSGDPAAAMSLTIVHTDKLAIHAAAMHSNADIAPRHSVNGTGMEMKISEPLFPNNGAMVWWLPKLLLPAQPTKAKQRKRSR